MHSQYFVAGSIVSVLAVTSCRTPKPDDPIVAVAAICDIREFVVSEGGEPVNCAVTEIMDNGDKVDLPIYGEGQDARVYLQTVDDRCSILEFEHESEQGKLRIMPAPPAPYLRYPYKRSPRTGNEAHVVLGYFEPCANCVYDYWMALTAEPTCPIKITVNPVY